MSSSNTGNNCVVLYSGGMDSMVVLHHAIKFYDQVYAISIDYGQKNIKELLYAEEYITDLVRKEIDSIKYTRFPLPVKLLNFN
jgi:7-cyano-7-deazaguanine synthase in queuosine biosynthesis